MNVLNNDILTNQELHMENVLSFRGKLSVNAVKEKMQQIDMFLSDNYLKKTAPTVTITYALEQKGMEQVLDMEILLAIDKQFSPPENCMLKPIFHLTNSVSIRHVGNPMKLQDTVNRLLEYIKNSDLTPITGAYNMTVKEAVSQDDLDNMIVDVYIGVSPNIT